MPTITVQGLSFDIIDKGDEWVIHEPRAILDQIAASIADTYRIQSKIAAEQNRHLPVGLIRLTVDVLCRKLPALAAEGGITILTDDMLVAPHVGEWSGTSAEDVAMELDRALANVRFWVLDSLDAQARHETNVADRPPTIDELGVRVADGRLAREQLRLMAVASEAAGELNEAEFARRGQVDRMTVRRTWLGKR